MPGLICIASSLNHTIDGGKPLEKMIESLSGKQYFTDRFCSAHFCAARVHLGTFNPGPQPVFNNDKNVCVLFDGELYGMAEEKQRLAKLGRVPINGDAELCLRLYEENGADFARRLNGSFIICIHDFNRRHTLVVSDRFGSRPHFISVNDKRFLMAPSAAVLLHYPDLCRSLDAAAVADWFAFGRLLGDKTFFEGIRAVKAGTILFFQDGSVSIKSYWNFPYAPDYAKSEKQFIGELTQTFVTAVDLRTKMRRHCAISLSGGLDSRMVAGAIPREAKDDFLAFSFGPRDCDEVKIAQKIAAQLGMKWHHFQIAPELLIENTDQTLNITEGMNYIGASYIAPIHREVALNADIVFDGFALDLTLGGSYLDKFLHVRNMSQLMEEIYNMNLFSQEERKRLFSQDFYRFSGDLPFFSLKQSFEESQDDNLLNQIDKFFLNNHVRRLTMEGYRLMRSQIEHCAPTMDNDLIGIIMTLPPELRARHYLYRKFLIDIFPKLAAIQYNSTGLRADSPLWLWRLHARYESRQAALARKIRELSGGKIFFRTRKSYVDFEKWFAENKAWRSYFENLLLNKKTISTARHLNRDCVERLFSEQYLGKKDNSTKILYIATFELFLKKFFPDS
jgi:asparagine synthase (glutamine-hydrolysing)